MAVSMFSWDYSEMDRWPSCYGTGSVATGGVAAEKQKYSNPIPLGH